MSFARAAAGGYRSSLLDRFSWLDHVFGTTRGGPPDSCLSLRQVHSSAVRLAGECQAGVEGDAILTCEPGVWVAVKTADCVPILLADPEHHVAAAVHAGWRGTAAGVVQAALMRMGEEFGTRPVAVTAAIGPAIGGCCYEVGPEVGSRFASIFPDRDDLTRCARIDLPEANRRILFQAGIPERQIDTAAICTACLRGELHSWRRDGEKAGRMLSGVCVLG